jgi:hypothetical protein
MQFHFRPQRGADEIGNSRYVRSAFSVRERERAG